ncbi:hypothetical protein RHMOL_Rhmol03G0288100 [Rhododendron molle]|uniref:Uncharacterized protein n=1 Tax=Rhododendron molle TaxID=49168 RepID=A0ACC0PMP0_RHOML|nr:hypothetical protein RHMOL_Rhmol03G0288100 [Rhododendron molle]
MVVIEPERREEEEKGRVNVTREPKSKPSAKTTSVDAEPSHSAKSGAVDADDGFETASESDFNGGDDDHDPEHNRQQEEPPQPMPPIDDSLEAVSDEESIQKALAEANDAKVKGNRMFGDGQYEEALSEYGLALQVAPDVPTSVEIRSICHANRALCYLKLKKRRVEALMRHLEKARQPISNCRKEGKYEESIKDSTKALELNPNYVKALLRRGEAHEKLEHFEEAIADLKKVLELDQSDFQVRRTIQRLEPLAAEKREKMKQEMIDKLKDMGNSVLGRFGMSIDNFKAVQDPNTGSYSISFQK